MRSIQITFQDGRVKQVDGIPEESKITLASLNPGSVHAHEAGAGITLRIYKGTRDNGNQIAVFRHVESFFDLALTITDKGEKKEYI